jgi:hypothetical protein
MAGEWRRLLAEAALPSASLASSIRRREKPVVSVCVKIWEMAAAAPRGGGGELPLPVLL